MPLHENLERGRVALARERFQQLAVAQLLHRAGADQSAQLAQDLIQLTARHGLDSPTDNP
jgi:hypothetical protein